MSERYDVIIVGGGSAGCVLAARLSELNTRRVLLIEAGRDMPPGEEPPDYLDIYPAKAAFDTRNHWPDLKVYYQPWRNSPTRPPLVTYEQPRIIGGGSAINGQAANRGTPDDYEEWASMGATGWGWNGVLPYFRKLETDRDFAGPLHGTDGPIAIHRVPKETWPQFAKDACTAFAAGGFAELDDQNGEFVDGYFPFALSNDGKDRVSTARGYLTNEVRRRSNLRILTGATLRKIILAGTRVTGVEVDAGGQMARYDAGRVIVSAGALHTPAILMRAGIGRAAELKEVGVEVVANLRGVGRNLQEHPGTSISAFIKRHARLGAETTRRHLMLGLRFSSGLEGAPVSDMHMAIAARTAWHPVGPQVGTMLTWLNKVFSTGWVKLRSSDPRAEPEVALNFLEDSRDMTRLVAAVRMLATFFAHPAVARDVQTPVPSSYSKFARRLARPTLTNYLLTAPVSLALDALPILREPFFRTFLSNGMSLAEMLLDDNALEDFIRKTVVAQYHVCGTCRMGSPDHPDTVVDPLTMEVHGISGLHVVDASVMPSVPRANTNIPTIMIAERAADLIDGADRTQGATRSIRP